MAEYKYNGIGVVNVDGANVDTLRTLVAAKLAGQGLVAIYVALTQRDYPPTQIVFNFGVNSTYPNSETNARALQALNNVFVGLLDFDGGLFRADSPTTNTGGNNPIPSNIPSWTGYGQGTYRVVAGDSLSKIAIKTGVSVANLISLNKNRYPSLLTNPNRIEIGWILSTVRVIDANEVNNTTQQNQQTTGQNIPLPNPASNPNNNNSQQTGSIEKFAEKIGLSVGALAIVGVVIAIVISKK